MNKLFFFVLLIPLISSCHSAKPIATISCNIISGLESSDEIQCGSLEVPENHDDPKGKKIQITYVILKTKNKNAAAYPMIFLSGGPGGKMLSEGRIKAWLNDPVREKRDIILLDQRGIGHSSPIPNMQPELFELMARDANEAEEQQMTAAVMSKFKKLCKEKQIGLEYYNSYQNARDVGQLMQHLGYKKYNLYGVSYGTRLARVIQDLFPEFLNGVIHNSPAPLNGDFLVDRLSSYTLALERIFIYCENDPDCKEQYPDLRKLYLKGIQRLKVDPIEVDLGGSSFFINAQDGIYLLRRKLYGNDSRAEIPEIIKAINEGGAPIINELVQFEKQFTNAINTSMLLSVERYENYDAQFTSEVIQSVYQDLPLLPAKLGFFNAFYEAGRNWHQATLQESEKEFKLSTVPSIIMVNHYDPVTPPENGYLFKEKIPDASLFVLDEGGHAGGNAQCRTKVMVAFMDDPKGELDSSCLNIYKEN